MLLFYDGKPSSASLSGLCSAGPDGPDYPSIAGLDSPLTPSERREIADAVIACWQRWAETGEP